ncbi:MAG: hypothetical protein ABW278_05515 [Steroidobacteraceae bacterium]
MTTSSSAGSFGVDGAADAPQLFVINLCSSTSPMALSHPSSPELKRYTFFVSRQREEGRERFRLHMGYFDTQEDAETLLVAIRDVYPAAWAGPAPTVGVPRRGRIAPVKLAAPISNVAAAPVAAAAPMAPAAPVAAAPALAPAFVAAPAVAPAPTADDTQLAETMTNVREVLAQLSEETPVSAPPRQNIEPPVVQPVPRIEPPRLSKPASSRPAAVLSPQQAMQLLEMPAAKPVPAAPAALASKPVAQAAPPQADLENEPDVRLMTPEDTQTLTDIKLDAQNNAPPCFAIQLVWSVSPIDVAALPHLAIFDAYTLYNVEGNRQGRKWYGLRLGFFTEPSSATQVANYVRSDYRSVAVVPVANKERDRASGGAVEAKTSAQRLGAAAAPLKPVEELDGGREHLDGFELLADDRPAPAKRDLDDVAPAKAAKPQAAGPARTVPVIRPAAAAAAAAGLAGAAKAAGKSSGRASGKRVVVRQRPDAPLQRTAPGSPVPMESTLEILGASTLSIDDGRAIINDTGARTPIRKPPNKFSKLLSRLSGG